MKNIKIKGFITKDDIYATIQEVPFAHLMVQDVMRTKGIILNDDNSVKFEIKDGVVKLFDEGFDTPSWYVKSYASTPTTRSCPKQLSPSKLLTAS